MGDNDLVKLLNHFPNESWDYAKLSRNPNITWEYVLAHSDSDRYQWDYNQLSENPNITWEIFTAHPDLFRNYSVLSRNPSITWDHIVKYPKFWCWDFVSQNPNITWDIIKAHPNELWNYDTMCMNPNITLQIFRDNPDKFKDTHNKFWISLNPHITWKTMKENPDIFSAFGGSYIYISQRTDVTFTDVLNNPDIDWDYDCLSCNPNIRWETIKQYSDPKKYPWNYKQVSRNPNITYEIVVNNPGVPWNFNMMSLNEFKFSRHLRQQIPLRKKQEMLRILRVL